MPKKQPRLDGLGEALRALRERRSLSQTALGKASGTSKGQVGEWERGEHDPSPFNLHQLLRSMSFDFADLEDALRTARGEQPRKPRDSNGDGPPGLERIMEAVRDEAVTREVDRRVAHMLREVLGFDPRTGSGGPGDQHETGGRRSPGARKGDV